MKTVLALNFPARGRKRDRLSRYSASKFSFWPLISPQGDGNTSKDRTMQYAFIVLALNFPARGRKRYDLLTNELSQAVLALNFPARGRKPLEEHHVPIYVPISIRLFWPLISPQGDGNDGMMNLLRHGQFLFWPLISPQGDGNYIFQ